MQTQRRTWLLYGCLAITGLLITVLLVAGSLWIIQRVSLYSRVAATLPAERRAAQQAGLLLGPQDLVRYPAVPNAQNAAPLYRQLTLRLKARPLSLNQKNSLYAVLAGRATASDSQATQQLLTLYAPELRLAERAAAMPDCDFQRQWQLGPDLPFPEYSPVRDIARLFAAQARLQSDAEHPEEALHAISVIGRMSQQMGQDPTVIAMLVRIALEAYGDRAWQHIVKAYPNRPGILRLAAQTDRAFGPLPDFRQAMRGEVVIGRVILNSIRTGKTMQPTATFSSMHTTLSRTAADAWEARYLSYWRRVLTAANSSPNDLLAAYRAIAKVGEAEEAAEKHIQATYELNAILDLVFSQAYLKIVHCAAQRRLRQTMLALFAYRQHAGRFPATLAALTPAAPLDPFTDQPLHYRRTQQGFVLYSVGEDFKDDGGNAQPLRKGAAPPDIVISYP